MTNLTKQLKKGELLPEGLYWVKHDGVINILDELEIPLTDVDEVLAEVPSYEEWKAKIEENTKLKEQLKECELWFTGVVGNMNDKNCGEHNRNLPIGNFEHVFKVFSQKINQVLGEE